MLILGIDPDTHNSGVALYSTNGQPIVKLKIVHTPVKHKGSKAVLEMAYALGYEVAQMCSSFKIDLAVVESQESYLGAKRGATPDSLITLAQVAGAGVAAAVCHTSQVMIPKPKQWKGQVPKDIHNKRIMKKLNLTPEIIEKKYQIKQPRQHHVIDALGMCVWASQL